MALTAARRDRREDSSIRIRPLYQRCRGCRHLRPGHLVWIPQHDAPEESHEVLNSYKAIVSSNVRTLLA
jgi:hypothetical protein